MVLCLENQLLGSIHISTQVGTKLEIIMNENPRMFRGNQEPILPAPIRHFCPSDTTQPDLHVVHSPNILSYLGAKGKLYNSEV